VTSVAATERRLVISEKYFQVTADLLARLRDLRASRPTDDIERAHDAFLLDPGLGPPTYLAADGRILWDDDMWGVEPTRGEAYAAIVVGARKTGLRDLLKLLPPRPPGTPNCGECNGGGRFTVGGPSSGEEQPSSLLCPACRGIGWRSAH
jgi:hypothetical protein